MNEKEGRDFFLKEIIGVKKTPKQSYRSIKNKNFFIVRDMIYKPVMTSRDIKRILKLDYQTLFDWGVSKVEFGLRRGEAKEGWRYFSIADFLSYGILKALRDMGIPLKNNEQLVSWIKRMRLVDSILEDFSLRRRVAIAFNYTGYYDIWSSWTNKKPDEFLMSILKSTEPVIVFPLNELFEEILSLSKRNEFYVKIRGDKEIVYYVYGAPLIVEEHPKSTLKEVNAKADEE